MHHRVLPFINLFMVLPAVAAAQTPEEMGGPTLSPGGWLGAGIRYQRVQHHDHDAAGAGLGLVGGYTLAAGLALEGGVQVSLHAPRYGTGSHRNSLTYARFHVGARYVTHPDSRLSASIGARLLLAHRRNRNSGRQTIRSGTGYGFSVALLGAARGAWVELGLTYDIVAIEAITFGTFFDQAEGYTSHELGVQLTFLVPVG
jgi:hypothetical protein